MGYVKPACTFDIVLVGLLELRIIVFMSGQLVQRYNKVISLVVVFHCVIGQLDIHYCLVI